MTHRCDTPEEMLSTIHPDPEVIFVLSGITLITQI